MPTLPPVMAKVAPLAKVEVAPVTKSKPTLKLVEVTLVKFPLPVIDVKLALVEVMEVRLALPVMGGQVANPANSINWWW